MTISILSGLIFLAVFAGVVFIHEFGHFIVARLCRVDVEEFGFGLPPRMLTFWREKGHLLLKSGKQVEIPRDFDMRFEWSRLLQRELAFSADPIGEGLVLRSIEMTEYEELKGTNGDPLGSDHLQLDETGQVAQARDESGRLAVKYVVGDRTQSGQVKFIDVIVEAHPGTAFTLNWLPLGGFVRPKGENDPGVAGGLAAASPWTRLAVLFAGPTMNLLLGVVVFGLLFFQIGIPDYTQVQIGEVLPDSPAAQAGIRVNDIIQSVNGTPITDATQLHDVIYANLDKAVDMAVLRGNQTLNLTVTPSSSRPQSEGAIGITMGPALVHSGSVIQSLRYGGLAVYEQTRALVLLPAQMIRGQASAQDSRFVGLKGIYDLFGQAVSRDVQSRESTTLPASSAAAPVSSQEPTYFTLQLIGVLTISLGVLNLFPFPALDGGRILFVLPELVIRRRIPPRFETTVNAIGMVLLLAFMVYVNVMDFVNPAVVNIPK